MVYALAFASQSAAAASHHLGFHPLASMPLSISPDLQLVLFFASSVCQFEGRFDVEAFAGRHWIVQA